MVVIKKRPGDNEDAMIRRFSREVMLSGVLLEARRRQFHLNRAEKKKQKIEEKRRLKKILA